MDVSGILQSVSKVKQFLDIFFNFPVSRTILIWIFYSETIYATSST